MTAKQIPDEARRERMTNADRRDAAYMIERKRIQAKDAEKTVRLRTLRLAKEATEREVAQKEAAARAANPATPKAKRKMTPPAGE